MSMFCWRSNTKASWKQKCSQCKRNYKTPNAFNIFCTSFLSFSEDKSQYTKVYKKTMYITVKKEIYFFFLLTFGKTKIHYFVHSTWVKENFNIENSEKYIDKKKTDRKVLSSDKKCTSAISRELTIIHSIGLLIEYDLAQFSMFEYRFWAAILCHKTLKCTTISTASNNNTITDDKMK